MKFIIATQELNYLINKCFGAISQKPAIPILSNFLIEAANGLLTITATDLSFGVRCTTEAKILEEGSTALPARTFSSLIRELTALNLELRTNDHHITEVIADASRFKIHGMSSNEYPELPNFNEASQLKVPQGKLKEMLFRTAFAVSREDTRYALTGVCLQVANKKAVFMGTDGKRLARASLPLDVDTACTGTFIIPIKAVEEFLKILDEEGTATVYLSNDKIAIENENTLILSKLLTGDYPDVQQVIPSKTDILVSLHRDELISLLRQVSLFAENTHHSVKFSFQNGELKLSANTIDKGEGKVSMPVDYHRDQLDVAFNPSFFIDILKHTKGETVSMGLTDSFNPGIIVKKGRTQSRRLIPFSC